MAAVIKDIKLDFLEENNVVVLAKQEDAGSRFIRVTFAEEGKPFPIAGASYVTLNVKKNDGHVVKSEGIVNDDGTATVPLVSQMLAVDGDAKADVSVFGVAPEKLTTMSFAIRVQESSVPDGTEISTDEFNDLITALAEIAGFAGVRDEVEDARGTYGTVEERLDAADNAQDIRITELRQQLAEANKTIANMGDGRITVDGGYGNISALPKTAAVAAMNSILYGMTLNPLVSQADVAVSGTISFNSVLNNKYYDYLHKTILTGTGSTMTITNDTAAVANINVIDLTAFGLATLTAAQCQAAFPVFFTGTQSAQVTCIEATGKNLFDMDEWYNLLRTKGNEATYPTSKGVDGAYNYVKVNPSGHYDGIEYLKGKFVANTRYTIQFSAKADVVNYTGLQFIYTDGTETVYLISSTSWANYTATSSSGKSIDRIRLHYTNIGYGYFANIQVEQATVATAYEPYKLEEQYIEPYNLYRVPNNAACKIDTANNEYVPSVKRYVLTADNITMITNTGVNADFIYFAKPVDCSIYGAVNYTPTRSKAIYLPGYGYSTVGDCADRVGCIGETTSSTMAMIVAKGTYATLAAAKTALAGTVIYYQLSDEAKQANTVKNVVTGNILSRPNGTIQFANKHSYTSMVVDGKLPTRTNYADVATVERLEKLNTDGTLTPLDTSTATIAADKRSISHPQLTNGAIARCKYAYTFAGVNGRKDISYLNAPDKVEDTVVSGTFYNPQIIVTNGKPKVKLTNLTTNAITEFDLGVAAAPIVWTALELINGWETYAPEVGAYLKDIAGTVFLTGAIWGPKDSEIIAFSLPAGYRPKHNMKFSTAIGSPTGIVTIKVQSNGEVKIYKDSPSAVYLEGVVFKAEQ